MKLRIIILLVLVAVSSEKSVSVKKVNPLKQLLPAPKPKSLVTAATPPPTPEQIKMNTGRIEDPATADIHIYGKLAYIAHELAYDSGLQTLTGETGFNFIDLMDDADLLDKDNL